MREAFRRHPVKSAGLDCVVTLRERFERAQRRGDLRRRSRALFDRASQGGAPNEVVAHSRLIRAYQLLLSPWWGRQCRFTPTCSEYAIEAIERHGAMRGTWLAIAPPRALPSLVRRRVRPGSLKGLTVT